MAAPSKFDVQGGWTPIPNWLLKTTVLTAKEKLVACSYFSTALGASVVTDDSIGINAIAKTHGLNRQTVRNAVERLLKLGVLTTVGERSKGFGQRCRVAVDRPAGIPEEKKTKEARSAPSRRNAKGMVAPQPVSTAAPQGQDLQRTNRRRNDSLSLVNTSTPPSVTSGSDGNAEPEVECTLDFEPKVNGESKGHDLAKTFAQWDSEVDNDSA